MSTEDYVPDVSGYGSTNGEPYDYTKDNSGGGSKVPFGGDNEVDLDTEVNTDFLSGTSPEEIEKSSYRQIPSGIHVCQIAKIEWFDDSAGSWNKVFVKRSDGSVIPTGYSSRKIQITFCLFDEKTREADENCTVRQLFTLSPDSGDRGQMEAFEYGFLKEEDAIKKNPKQGGYAAKQLRYFLARLGFQFDANGRVPREANKVRNWQYYPGTDFKRLIRLEVMPGKIGQPYMDRKTGQMVTPTRAFANIKNCSYSLVPTPAEVLVSQHAALIAANRVKVPEAPPVHHPAEPAPQSDPQPAATQAAPKKQKTQV